jgi:hypothetical protein
MSDLDRLPPDQRAVLSLVLERGKSYGEVADMLAIPESAVRERAHAALDALATAGASIPRPAAATPPRTARARAARPASPSTGAPRSPRSSKTGGALLLGAIVVVIVVVVVLVSSGGGKSSSHNTTTGTTTGTTSTSASSKTKFDNTIVLTAAEPGIKASGKAYVLSRGGQTAFYISAQGLPPSSGFFYAVWLYNSPTDAKPLGRAPTVSSTGAMEGGDPLPSDADHFHQLIVTRETSTNPSQPGPMVLTGPFSLH